MGPFLRRRLVLLAGQDDDVRQAPIRFWRPAVDDEVDAEFDFHVEMRRASSSPPDGCGAASEAAIRRFGDIRGVNAACRTIGRRRDADMRRTEYRSERGQDGRFACRQLLATPGFTFVAVATLALGIGATTAIFSAVHAVVLKPLPFPEPRQVFAVYESWRGGRGNVSAGNYVDAIAAASSFSGTTAIQYSSFNVGDGVDAERVIGARATPGFFTVFPMPPALGRVYTADEDQPGREQVVVLSHRLWVRRFHADRGIVGRQIQLSGKPYDVIGVMPPAYDFTETTEQLWVPIAFTPERKATHDEHYLQSYARLRPGRSSRRRPS